MTLAYNPRSVLVPVAQVAGLTWTVLTPGSIPRAAVCSQAKAPRSLWMDASTRSSKAVVRCSSRSAAMRSAVWRQSRRPVHAARSGSARGAQFGPLGDKSLLLPTGREVLARYLKGGRFVFDVDRAADIRQVLAFAKRYGIKPVIAGGGEAWVVAEELAAANVPVLLDPLANLPSSFDRHRCAHGQRGAARARRRTCRLHADRCRT